MVIELRCKILILFAAFLTGLLVLPGWASAQIEIRSSSGYEVGFTQQETNYRSAMGTVSLRDGNLGSVIGVQTEELNRFSSQPAQQNGYFFVDAAGGSSIGSYYHTHEDHDLVAVSLTNKTDDSFDRLTVAFDFIYLPERIREEQAFQLSYRVNNGHWRSVSEGRFTTEYLKGGESGWNSFSMQVTLENLFQRPDDNVEFRWQAVSGSAEEYMPIALQKMDVTPRKAAQRVVRPGTVIITEVLPGFNHQGQSVEYIELFNTGADSLNLKGLVISNDDNQTVIQDDVYIRPYSHFLVGLNTDRSLPLEMDYEIPESILTGNSGRLKLAFGSSELAGAIYEASEPGVALEIDHMRNAYDGYTGLSNLVPSESELSERVAGSPGFTDPASSIYEKTFYTPGWHFINPPGVISPLSQGRTAPSVLVSDRSTVLTETRLSDLSRPSPFWTYVEDGEPLSIYAEGTDSPFDISASKLLDDDEPVGISMFGNPLTTGLSITNMLNEAGDRLFPAVKTWDPDQQQFRVVFDEDEQISPWAGMITPKLKDDTAPVFSTDGSTRDAAMLASYLSMELYEEAGSNQYERVDNSAVIGFLNSRNNRSSPDYHLPKIWPVSSDGDDAYNRSLLYLSGVNSMFDTNSFLHVPFELDETVQIALGTYLSKENHRYKIRWNRLQNIPEEWVIELVNTDTDQIIDMREYLEYTFQSGPSDFTDGMELADKSFNFVEALDHKNLFVRISPKQQFEESEKDREKPESVNLKQNYPNPFNPTTTISFYLPENSFVRLGVYNVVGQQVALLREESLSNGEHSVVWNASDMPSGIYIVQLETPNSVHTRKITLIK